MSIMREDIKKLVDNISEEKLYNLYKYIKKLKTSNLHDKNIIDPAKHLRGLHKNVWEDIDVNKYIDQERDSWQN